MSKFVLIGSGLAGGVLAAYLGRRGHEVELYERRADPREGNIVGGRSINLALSTRGIYALQHLGIADEVLRQGEMTPGSTVMISRNTAGDEEDKPLDLEIIAPKKPKRKAEPEREKVGVGAKKDDGEGEPEGDEPDAAGDVSQN